MQWGWVGPQDSAFLTSPRGRSQQDHEESTYSKPQLVSEMVDVTIPSLFRCQMVAFFLGTQRLWSRGDAFLISQTYNSSSVPLVALFSLDFKNTCIFKSPNDTINSLRVETGSWKCWVHIKYPTNVSLIEYDDSSVSAKYFH